MSAIRDPHPLVVTERWAVIDKPPGWLTIEGRSEAPVLLTWARAQLGEVWVCHRLDRDTSGVLLFARTAEAHRQANQWFESHLIKKSYDFLCAGCPKLPVFKIQSPIRDQKAVTQVESVRSWKGASVGERTGVTLGRARPTTGRRHQIRIHLSSQGHPLLGDVEYGGAERVHRGDRDIKFTRVALHARTLELPGGERFEAPLPEDFRSWLEDLEGEAP